MKKLVVLTFATAIIFGMWGLVGATIIHFDDIPGMRATSFYQGQPIPSKYLVDDEYSHQGVLFESGVGGLRVAQVGNAISGQNMVVGTTTDPEKGIVSDYYAEVSAYFRIGGIDGPPAVVDQAGLTLSNTSKGGTLNAWDLNDILLGSVRGGSSATLCLSFPGQIHSITFKPNHAAFDNFTFSGLSSVPIPGAVWLFGSGFLGLVGITRFRRKRKK